MLHCFLLHGPSKAHRVTPSPTQCHLASSRSRLSPLHVSVCEAMFRCVFRTARLVSPSVVVSTVVVFFGKTSV